MMDLQCCLFSTTYLTATDLFYGKKTCHDVSQEFVECADPTGCGTGPGSKAWDFQVHTTCSYMYIIMIIDIVFG